MRTRSLRGQGDGPYDTPLVLYRPEQVPSQTQRYEIILTSIPPLRFFGDILAEMKLNYVVVHTDTIVFILLPAISKMLYLCELEYSLSHHGHL